MRLLRSVILSLVIVVVGCTTVFADGTVKYKIPEIGVTIEVPDNLLCYTRTSEIDESVINALGYTSTDYQDHLIETMKEENNYFVGFNSNVDFKVTLKSIETTMDSFSEMTEEEVWQAIDDGLEGELTAYGVEVSETSIFTENDRKYAVVNLSDSIGKCQLYAIVENNQMYYFYVRSFSGEVGDANQTLIKQIAGTADFYEKSEAVDEPVADDTEKTTTTSSVDKDNNVISRIVDIVKLVVVAILALLVIVIIVSKITKPKSAKRKVKSNAVNYSNRRDVIYEERLSRIMGTKEEPKIEEASLPDEDLYL